MTMQLSAVSAIILSTFVEHGLQTSEGYCRLIFPVKNTAVSREVVGMQKCTRQFREVTWDMINSLNRTDAAYLTFFYSCKHISMACHYSFIHLLEMLETRKGKKISFPTAPFGLVASILCIFFDNLSQNTCIRSLTLHVFMVKCVQMFDIKSGPCIGTSITQHFSTQFRNYFTPFCVRKSSKFLCFVSC